MLAEADGRTRVVFAEIPGFNVDLLHGVVGTVFDEYGRVPEDQFALGRYWDTHVVGVPRPRWEGELWPCLEASLGR